MALRFVTTVIISRTFGADTRGLYAAAGTATEAADRVFAAGRPDAIAFHVSRGHDAGPLLREAAAVLRRRTPISILAGIFLGSVPSIRSQGAAVVASVVVLVASSPLLASMKSCWREARLARGESGRQAIAELVRALVPLVVVTTVALVSVDDIEAAGAVLVLGFAAGEIAARLVLQTGWRPQGGGAVPATFAPYARSAYLGSLAQPLNQRLDQLLLLLLVSIDELGFYAAAVSLSLLVAGFGVALAQVIYPAMVHGDASSARARSIGVRLSSMLLVSLGPVVLVCWVYASELLDNLFGREFVAASSATRILLLGAVVTAVSSVLHGTLLAMGRPDRSTRAQAVGLAVQLVLIVPLTMAWGIEGTAMSSLASYVLRLVFIVASLREGEADGLDHQHDTTAFAVESPLDS